MRRAGTQPRRRSGRAAWIAAGIALDAAYVTRRQLGALRSRPPAGSARGPEGGPVVRTTPVPPGAGRPPAVVLIPGIYEPSAFLDPLRTWLEERGHEVAAVEELGWNLRTVPESAALIRDRLRSLGLSDVLVIAHSKGGLIGKELMVTAPPGLVAGMITVSTPFGGHPFSRLAPTPALRGFRTTDPVILALAAERAVNASIVSIGAEVDPIVTRGTWLEGAHNICLPVVGHFRILGHSAFLACLDELLDTAAAAEDSGGERGTAGEG